MSFVSFLCTLTSKHLFNFAFLLISTYLCAVYFIILLSLLLKIGTWFWLGIAMKKLLEFMPRILEEELSFFFDTMQLMNSYTNSIPLQHLFKNTKYSLLSAQNVRTTWLSVRSSSSLSESFLLLSFLPSFLSFLLPLVFLPSVSSSMTETWWK